MAQSSSDEAEMLRNLDLLLAIDPGQSDVLDVFEDLDILTDEKDPEEEP